MTKEEKIDYVKYCKDNNIYRTAALIYDVCNKKQIKYLDDIPLDILKQTTLELSKENDDS